MQFRTGVLFTVSDIRMPDDVADGIMLFQQPAYLPEHPFLTVRIAVPESCRLTRVVDIDIRRSHFHAALRHETTLLQLQTTQIVQLDTDGITVQVRPSVITAPPGVLGFRIERH